MIKTGQMLIYCSIVYAMTLDDIIYVNGLESQEMVDKGKEQYQLLQERGKLPKYGTCWTAAVDQVHEGCKYLTEETQSDIALTLTNCFLQMSGHETYNCELDKKVNLRGICINSMSDRAFSVYTKFYIHAQNMCWFLRRQVWQEIITENTMKVGKQLTDSVVNQEKMLKNQEETLNLQEKMMNYTNDLNLVIEKFYSATKTHHDLMKQVSDNLGSLQSFLIGELSFFDSLIHYSLAILLFLALTSIQRTKGARLPILLLFLSNFVLERLICKWFSTENQEASVIYANYKNYIIIWRNICLFLCVVVVVLTACLYRDVNVINNALLEKLLKKNDQILDYFKDQGIKFNNGFKYSNGNVPLIKGTPRKASFKYENDKNNLNSSDFDSNLDSDKVFSVKNSSNNVYISSDFNSRSNLLENLSGGVLNHSTPLSKSGMLNDLTSLDSFEHKPKYEPKFSLKRNSPDVHLITGRYNLRSRNGTPDV